MSAAGWAGLAGFANSIGKSLQQRHDDEEQAKKDAEKEKLLQLQQDAEQKRQMFLAKYSSDLRDTSKVAEDERTKDDVVSHGTNAETGDVLGFTKSGKAIPLSTTSDEYKAAKKAQLQAQVANTQALATNRQGANKGPVNPNYGTARPAPDNSAPPQQQSPTQPSAPTPDQIMAEANAAIKRGAPQDAVEAKMKALFQQYGYSPQ